jgi:hypothetical protein
MRAPGHRRFLVSAACGLAMLAAGGCGDEDSSESSVAQAVPAEAIFFGQAVVRPEGEDRERLDALLEPFLGEASLEERLDEALSDEQAGISYTEDVEPWLGEHAALWFADLDDDLVAGEEAEEVFSYVVEVTDEEEARSFIERSTEESGADVEEGSYEGVDYMSFDGQAIAATEGLIIGGTQAGLEASIDALAGDSLADQDDLADDATAALELGDGTLAGFYLDMPAVFALAEEEGELTPDDREAIDQLVPELATQPLGGTMTLGDGVVSFDLGMGSIEGAAGTLEESPLLSELPADSIAAIGSADVGESYARLLELAEEIPQAAGDEDLDDVRREFELETGLPLDDLLTAIGDTALFVSGGSLFDAGGALVVETLDPGVTESLIGSLRKELARDPTVELGPGLPADAGLSIGSGELPEAFEVAQRGDRFVIGYGAAAVEEAFEPEQTLESSEKFTEAREAFGDELGVGGFVDIAGVIELASLGSAFNAELAEGLGYLESLDYLIYGAGDDGERTRLRLVIATG